MAVDRPAVHSGCPGGLFGARFRSCSMQADENTPLVSSSSRSDSEKSIESELSVLGGHLERLRDATRTGGPGGSGGASDSALEAARVSFRRLKPLFESAPRGGDHMLRLRERYNRYIRELLRLSQGGGGGTGRGGGRGGGRDGDRSGSGGGSSGGRNRYDDDIDDDIDDDEGGPGQYGSWYQSSDARIQVLKTEKRGDLEDVEDRNAEILRMENDVYELTEVFSDVRDLVTQQHGAVLTIEEKAGDAKDAVRQGHEELVKTHAARRKGMWRKFCCLFFLVFFLAILVLGWYYKWF